MNTSPKLNWLERTAVSFLRERNGRIEEKIRRLDTAAIDEIRRLERSTILIAAFSGLLSGALIGGLEVWLNVSMPDAYETVEGILRYWIPFILGSVLVSAVEIVFLYWLVLGRVGQISDIAGIRLSEAAVEQVIAVALSRAALDVPDPREPFFGIDPLARVPRWKLVLFALAYRLKIGVTSFVIRLLLRRILGRAAVRTLIPMVAIFVYSVWNAIIIAWIMRASRLRAVAPFAIREFGLTMSLHREKLTVEQRQILVMAVAEAIQVSALTHPSFGLLLRTLLDALEVTTEEISWEHDWDSRRASFRSWTAFERTLLLETVTFTMILAGRPGRRQRQFIVQTFDDCDQPFDRKVLEKKYEYFYSGQGWSGPE